MRLLKSTLKHLDEVKPEMLIVKTVNKYGIVMKAVEPMDSIDVDDDAYDEEESTVTRGVISRIDLREVEKLMVHNGYEIVKARVCSVSAQGAFAMLEVDVPDDFMADVARDGSSVWDDWNWVNALSVDGLLDCDMFGEVEETITKLDLGFEMPGAMSDAMMVRDLNKLIKASRFDVSRETQEALSRYRHLVMKHGSERVRSLFDKLVRAINDIGSEERITAFRNEYFPAIKTRLDNLRKPVEAMHSDAEREALRQSAYEALRQLPENLFYDISDKGEFMHRLLYVGNGIPRKKLMMLMDALCVWEGQTEAITDFVALPEMVSMAIRTDAVRSRLFKKAMVKISERIATRGMAWKWSHVKKVLEDEEMVSVETNSEFAREVHEMLPDVSAGACRMSIQHNALNMSRQDNGKKYWELADTNKYKRVFV